MDDGDGGQEESCLLCLPGFTLRPDGSCQAPTTSLDPVITFVVLGFEGLQMTSGELLAMQSTSATFGENLAEPFYFL